MYATRASGTDPIGPVNNRTGLSFIPGTSPEWKLGWENLTWAH
jgi:hypothetical protein